MIYSLLRFIKRNIIVRIKPSQTILLGFLLVVLLGAVLLTLPAASQDGRSIGFVDALFTATSATCVTGLVVVDTYTHWTLFGKAVILFLIQIGGLGFMTVATMLSFFLRRTITMRERLLMAESLNHENMQGVVRLVKHILIGTFLFEGIGAVILTLRFIPDFGLWGGFTKGVFHSVSSFCNAGFDLMGQNEPFSSLTAYSGDWVVNLTIMSLIVIGGLGFMVWEDLFQNRRWSRLRLHTKIVLTMTVLLILGGYLMLTLLEFNNPETIADASASEKILVPLFQSVTARTAGYNTVPVGSMTQASLFIIIILMFIGGSPGSTAGGVKTSTVGVLLLVCAAVMHGESEINVFGRRLKRGLIMRVIVILMLSIIIVVTGTIIVLAADNFSFLDTFFEVVSAFGTVGLSTGITADLSVVSRITLTTIMFLGRVGVMTAVFAISLRRSDQGGIQFPEGNIMVG